MKALGLKGMLSMFFLMVGGISVYSQDQVEVPGDHFSLEGALELFKKSASPEEFERMLNSADSRVNNLDLNGDGDIDYIRVIDRTEGNVHAFILQAVVSESETQDVAVIELEKLADGKAVLQITGDEDIYGVETIIEPTREVRTYAGTTTTRTVVNVWAWPSVQYVYGPYYSVWVSPWRWSYRPFWWHPWRPIAYYDYYPYWYSYRSYYSPCYTHRVVYAQGLYRPYRTTSVVVHNRHNRQISHYRSTRNDNGRNRYDDGRAGGRQSGRQIRYDANGRLASSTGDRTTSRSTANTWRQGRDSGDNSRSYVGRDREQGDRTTSDLRSRSQDLPQRSSGQRSDLSNKWLGADHSSDIRPRETRPNGRVGESGPSRSSTLPRSERTESGNVPQRSYGGSSGNAHVQRSTASPQVQRSSSPNVQRSSGGSPVQRSSGGSPGGSHVQRSSGGSPGGSHVQRSSGGSSGSSGVQRSSGSTGTQRSGGVGGRSSGGQQRGR